MSEARFTSIESRLTSHEKDIHTISQSLEGINAHMGKANELLQSSLLKDERINSKIDRLQSEFEGRLTISDDAIKRAHQRTDQIEGTISKLAWIVITMIIAAVVASVIKMGA